MLCELDFEKKKEASNKEVSTKGLKKEKCRKPDGPCIQHDFFNHVYEVGRGTASKTRKYVQTLRIAPFHGGAPTFSVLIW